MLETRWTEKHHMSTYPHFFFRVLGTKIFDPIVVLICSFVFWKCIHRYYKFGLYIKHSHNSQEAQYKQKWPLLPGFWVWIPKLLYVHCSLLVAQSRHRSAAHQSQHRGTPQSKKSCPFPSTLLKSFTASLVRAYMYKSTSSGKSWFGL